MKFCPECGSPIQQGAKFCVTCGQPLSLTAAPAPQRARLRIPPAFALVFLAIVIVGMGAAGILIRRHRNEQVQQQGAQAPSKLPPGHPQVELPAKAREFISDLRDQAKKQPKNVAIWNRLGTVALRAALFDPSYHRMAAEAYGHVLQLDPENLEALRGIGNLDYDQQKYDEAVAAYEHYLKHKPDDPDVQTDLGTMYLYTGNPDQAIKRYQKAISIKPGFYDAYFNLGVAYGAMNDPAKARAALAQALKSAPDQEAKSRVNSLLAKLGGGAGAQVASAGGAGAADGGVGQPSSGAASNSFEGRIESMVRGLPFAGPKVQSVRWDSKNKATVLMNDFPMDAMPPFARQKFISDLGSGIEDAKKASSFNGPFELQIADAASGQVMETVSK
ncbi:MAG TPA: tetratricopeptide repeat protein [Candidatus Binataceae bacterium]|nr:tetratricopeptide repeat protein [Candidatus Binataceae bacterium]